MWFVIFGVLLILIIAIIITMAKIIRGSNDLQEMRERPSGRERGTAQRRGGGNRNDMKRGNSRSDHNRHHSNRDEDRRRERPAPPAKPRRTARGGGGRRWKVILVDITTHEEYEFIFSDSIGVGRAFARDGFEDYLVINDPKVSKRHCSIFSEGDNLYIQDEGSSNHTFVNNQRVSRPMMIQKEDIIGIGNTDLEVYKVFRESK